MLSSVDVQRTFERAVAEHRAGRLPQAGQLYGEVLRREPQHEQASFLAAAIALEAGQLAEAARALTSLVERHPHNAVYWTNLGEALRRQGHLEPAASALSRAVTLSPDLAQAHFNLGLVLQQLGEPGLSLQAFERAAGLDPSSAALQRALKGALRPETALGLHQRSLALVELSRFDEALRCSEQALALEPRSAALHTGRAAALVEVGRLDAGLAEYRAAVALDPHDHLAHSNVVFLSAFQVGVSAQALLDEARAWAQRHAEPLAKRRLPHHNTREPERRLRVGYVSSNFNQHCQALFTLPVLEHHDRQRFELFAYASQTRSDEVTTELRSHFEHWHDISSLDAAAAAELIRGHGIDILVDLTMHMATATLHVFACKPAPVQVAWLAYPGTTGLGTMDYRVTDRHLDPPELPSAPYAEESLVLPDTFWCYRAGNGVPEVSPVPALSRGHVTFGSLNAFWKLNQPTLQLWARVLTAVPHSKLLLLAPEGAARARVLDVLRGEGVDEERIEFASRRPRLDYLKLYQRIDVGLDSLPYNGHTTSLDAFFMGVPVVTLIGETVVGRAGLCQARNLGLPELIADTPDAFVAAAVRLATDLDGLAQLRAGLRERLQGSPLMDAPRFVANLEAAYRKAWRRWCESTP
jgi:protein O-GlcNAc transferase